MLPQDIKFWTSSENLRVVNGYLTDGSAQMKVGCHHHAKRDRHGYCGGCAARIDRVVDVVEILLREKKPEEALKVIEAMNAARIAEVRR